MLSVHLSLIDYAKHICGILDYKQVRAHFHRQITQKATRVRIVGWQ